MDIITIDYETFWSQDYSLSKMSPLEYVLGDEYETISCAIKLNHEPSVIAFGDADVQYAFRQLNVAKSGLLAHNMSGFDAYIAAYRHGLKPRVWLDTAAMARPIHAKTIGVSLVKLVLHYKVGVKDNTVLMQTRGKHLKDFTAAELSQMAIYNRADTDQCRALLDILRELTPAAELWQIDLITRMRTEPAFKLDAALLRETLQREIAAKRSAMAQLSSMLHGVTPDLHGIFNEDELIESVRADLASTPKFAALLESLGVEVPMKPSPSAPGSGKMVPALAKSDEEFVEMQNHDNPLVAAAATARLAVKSTLLETRINKFLRAGELAGGKLPIPIRYAGADTSGRDSGEEYNALNMPRVDKDRPRIQDALRQSLCAPADKTIIVADLSNIELRVNHTLWMVQRSTDLWAANPDADLYTTSAAARYGIPESEVQKPQRQLAKIEELGLGFGSGADTFRKVARLMSGGKIDLSKVYRHATQSELDRMSAVDPSYEWPTDKEGFAVFIVSDPAQESVTGWRLRYPEIVAGWRRCDEALAAIYRGEAMQLDDWGLCCTIPRVGIQVPGYVVRYPNLRKEQVTDKDGFARTQWVYAEGRHKAGIYGSKAVENIVQSIARRVICDNTIEFFRRTGLRPALRPYDELAYVVDAARAEELLAELQAVMRTPPTWWPALTVWSEGSMGSNYGEAK